MVKRTLAGRTKKEIREIQDERLGKEFEERVEGVRTFNTFDLNDVDRIGLKVLTEPMLDDVKKIVLWADEKRNALEDYRALRRNRNDWIILIISVCIGVVLPFVVPTILVWALNACTLAPQSVVLAIKTVRRY